MSERPQIVEVPLTQGRLLVVERTSPVTIDARSHERLRVALAEVFGQGGTLTSFERVLGWVQGERGVEVHVQVAPLAGGDGSAIRLVQHGVLVAPRVLGALGIGMIAFTLSGLLAAVLLGGEVVDGGLLAFVLGVPTIALAMIATVSRFQTRRRTKKLAAGADALLSALAAAAPPPVQARVDVDPTEAEPAIADEIGRSHERRGD
jgi:hypothetical protein